MALMLFEKCFEESLLGLKWDSWKVRKEEFQCCEKSFKSSPCFRNILSQQNCGIFSSNIFKRNWRIVLTLLAVVKHAETWQDLRKITETTHILQVELVSLKITYDENLKHFKVNRSVCKVFLHFVILLENEIRDSLYVIFCT